jgi:hypothetical protein
MEHVPARAGRPRNYFACLERFETYGAFVLFKRCGRTAAGRTATSFDCVAVANVQSLLDRQVAAVSAAGLLETSFLFVATNCRNTVDVDVALAQNSVTDIVMFLHPLANQPGFDGFVSALQPFLVYWRLVVVVVSPSQQLLLDQRSPNAYLYNLFTPSTQSCPKYEKR